MSEFIKVGKEYVHKCENCIHFNTETRFCRAYKTRISLLDVKNCRRRKNECMRNIS